MFVVADEPDLLALYLPSGSELAFGTEGWPTETGIHGWDQGPGTTWQGHGALHLHRPDDPYSVWALWHGPEREAMGWYVNIQAAFQRTPIGIDTLDQELDIVVGLDGEWAYKDAELMDQCIELDRFTRSEVDEIKSVGEGIGQMLDAGEQWWDPKWLAWTPPPEMDQATTVPADWNAAFGESA